MRPHHAFGTVELRICDAQTRGDEAFNLAALIVACIAQSALDYDDGRLAAPLRQREIEENLWQAIRYGLEGAQIDFAAARGGRDRRRRSSGILEWTEPAREALGLEVELPPRTAPSGPGGGSPRAPARPTSTARRSRRPRRTYAPAAAD